MGIRPPSVEHGGGSVEQQVSFGGTEGMSAPGLARRIRQGIELLSRPPATGGGTARRRGSTRSRTGLPGSDRGGWVTRPLGPETTSVSTGSVTGTGHLKGPCDSYSQGPFAYFRWCRGSGLKALAPQPPMAQFPSTVGIWSLSVENRHLFCGRTGQFRWNQKNVPESSCAPRSRGHRTSLTPSGNGERDSSKTKVHT